MAIVLQRILSDDANNFNLLQNDINNLNLSLDDLLLEEVNRLVCQYTSRPPLTRDEFCEALRDEYFYLFIARDTETLKVAGMGSIFFQRNLVRWFAEIHDVVVDARMRNRGIGRMIVTKLLETARKFALLRCLVLPVYLTSKPSRVAANALYSKMGFKLLAVAEGNKGTNLYLFTVEPS